MPEDTRDYRDAVPFPRDVTLRPIVVVRSPFTQRHGTPRQPTFAAPVLATIELLEDIDERVVQDLSAFDHIWLLSWFHLNGPRRKPLVRPPRGGPKRGVLSTRSPHRPNPIGLTAVRLVAIEGRRLTVSGIDLIDGTPILDIKPYVPGFDAIPEASGGWLPSLHGKVADQEGSR